MKRKNILSCLILFAVLWSLAACKQTPKTQTAENADFVAQEKMQTPDSIIPPITRAETNPKPEKTEKTTKETKEPEPESTTIPLYPRTQEEAIASARQMLTDLYGNTLFEDFELQITACDLFEDDTNNPNRSKMAAFYVVRFAQPLGADGFIQGLRFSVSVVQNSGLARRPELIDLTPYYALDPSKLDTLTKQEVDSWVDSQMEQFGVANGSEHIEHYQIAETNGTLSFEILVFCHENGRHIEKYLHYPIDF